MQCSDSLPPMPVLFPNALSESKQVCVINAVLSGTGEHYKSVNAQNAHVSSHIKCWESLLSSECWIDIEQSDENSWIHSCRVKLQIQNGE